MRPKPQKKARPVMLDELIRRYALDNEAQGKSPKTITWYSDLLKQYYRYLKENTIIPDITAINRDCVRAYMLYLRSKNRFDNHPHPAPTKPLSPQTVQCHIRCLKAFATWLSEEGYNGENSLQHLKLPKAPAVITEPLTPAEIDKIINSIDKAKPTGIRNHAILVTMLDSGLRAAEVASIALDKLNLEDGFVKVMGKGSKERIVPLGNYACKVLWSYIDKTRPKPRVPGRNDLFLSPAGDPISANTLKLMFARLAKVSAIKRLHAHLCRHTFATNYLWNGGDIFSLKEILGHSTLTMVSNYLHFSSLQVTALQHQFSPMDRLKGGEAYGPGVRRTTFIGDSHSPAQKIPQRVPSTHKQSKLQPERSNRSSNQRLKSEL
ncbi:tyrosine-type recombinase/integrase [Chloroflexota bacterium]